MIFLLKELERLRQDEMALSRLNTAMDILHTNNIVHFLRGLGRPLKDPKSTAESLAQEASYASGWQDCLDSLVYFRDIYLAVNPNQKTSLRPDYGGRRSLLNEGRISEEEFKDLGNPNSKFNTQRVRQ